MARDDGGQAFPGVETPGGGIPGMSLRDYFAGLALNGLLSDAQSIAAMRERYKATGRNVPLAMAEACYEFADAMLEARDK